MFNLNDARMTSTSGPILNGTPLPVEVGEHPQRWRTLAFLSTATVLSLTVWFSTNAIAPALQTERGFSSADIAWLTIAVSLGFVLGTIVVAATNLADLVNTRKLFAISAVLAGVSNVALVFLPGGFATALVLRVLSGVFLGGVYPPGMKILSVPLRSWHCYWDHDRCADSRLRLTPLIALGIRCPMGTHSVPQLHPSGPGRRYWIIWASFPILS